MQRMEKGRKKKRHLLLKKIKKDGPVLSAHSSIPWKSSFVLSADRVCDQQCSLIKKW